MYRTLLEPSLSSGACLLLLACGGGTDPKPVDTGVATLGETGAATETDADADADADTDADADADTDTDTDTDTTTTTDTGTVLPPALASLRLAHLVVDLPAIDGFVNSDEPALFPDLVFGSLSPYRSVEAGLTSLDVSVHPGSPASATLRTLVDLAPATDTTVLAVGRYLEAPLLVPVFDDVAGLPPGSARITWVQAAADYPRLDLYDLTAKGDPDHLLEGFVLGSTGFTPDRAGPGVFALDLDGDEVVELTYDLPAWTGPVSLAIVSEGRDQVYLFALLSDGESLRIDPRS